MNIKEEKTQETLTLTLTDRLDTTTAPKLEEVLNKQLDDVILKLVFDVENLEYLSSAGLRILLDAYKKMKKREGTMIIRNVNDEVMQVFKITGFSDFLTIEQK